MPSKDTTPLSLYGNDREYLREQERTNELLADIAGETYESPGNIPNGKYILQKRMLDAAQKKNELLESIAGSGGGGGAAKGIDIDYGTDVISLKNKDGDPIQGSGATLPAYGVSFDPTTGGLTLTKNGTAMQGQTVTIPNYGSPVGVTSSSAMTDEGTIYLYEGTTGGGYTQGHFYYWDGTAWADGGEYAAATVQTDKTLLVENRAADAKATGEAIGDVVSSVSGLTSSVSGLTNKFETYDDTVVPNLTETVDGVWKSGSISPTYGTNGGNINRIRNNDYIDSDIARIIPTNGYQYYVCVWDPSEADPDKAYQGVLLEDGTIQKGDFGFRTKPVYLPVNSGYKFRLVATLNDHDKITASDGSNIKLEKVINVEELKEDVPNKIAKPAVNPDGTSGQVLQTNGDGTTTWIDQSEITSGVQADVDLKINKPITSPDGTSGQVLQTNGDGTTTWVDKDLPSEEQTKSAVENYFTQHPEARAAVADESLTKEKFSALLYAEAIKDYVTPEMYGAKGDDTADDTAAIQSALNYAVANKKPLFFGPRTYRVTSTLTITYDDDGPENRKIYISGFGSESVIKACSKSNNGFSDGDSVFHINCRGSGLKDTYVGNFAIHFDSGLHVSIIGIRVKRNPGPNALFENLHIHDNERTTSGKVGIEICRLDSDGINPDTGEPIKTEATCVTFRRIVGRYINGAGIVTGATHSVLFTECDMVRCYYGIYIGGGSNIKIENCRFDEALFGIYCNGSQDSEETPNVNEEIYSDTKLLRYKGFQGSPHNVTIRNNRFENTQSDADTKYGTQLRAGIMLVGYGTQPDTYLLAQNINIFGNYFDGITVGDGLNIHGMVLARIKSITISNNDFKARDNSTDTTLVGGKNILTTPDGFDTRLYDISLFMNRCLKLTDNSQSSTELPLKLLNEYGGTNGLINNLEYNQTTVPTHIVNPV